MRDDREADSPATRTARLSRRSLLRRGLAGLALTGSGLTTAAPTTARSAEATPAHPATNARTQTAPQFTQQQKLTADDGDSDDSFGESVSVSNDGATALIAAFEDEDPNGDRAGSAYVFTESGGSWSQQQKLAADDGDIDDGFGVSVSLSDDGTTALIGAADVDERNDDEETDPGSAYVFTKSGGSWSQQQKLTATDRDTADVFGTSVSLSDDGTTALIGASGNESAYIFTESGGTWSQQQKLSATDGDGGGFFGTSVSLSDDGTTALISDFGSAFIFTRSEGRWDQQQKLTTADGTRANFGSVTIANDGTAVLIGVLSDDNSNGDRAGSAFVFTKGDESWSQQQKLIATDGDSGDNFGRSVSLSADGTTAVIGADADENSNGDRAGSTYVFSQSDGNWSQQQKLTADGGGSTNFFGRSVSVSDDGTTPLIGAPFASANGEDAGSAYVFSGGDQQDPAPGDGSEGPVELSLEAPGTVQPGGTVTVTAELTNRDVPEPSSGSIELTTVPGPLSVAGDSANPVFLGFAGNALPAVGESVTQQFEITVPEEAAVEQELTLEAVAVVQNDTDERTTTTTQTVTITDQQAPVERFDQNGEPGIQGDEVLDAISEFNEGGDVEATDVLDVISAFNENSG